jgi:hypothetical protein
MIITICIIALIAFCVSAAHLNYKRIVANYERRNAPKADQGNGAQMDRIGEIPSTSESTTNALSALPIRRISYETLGAIFPNWKKLERTGFLIEGRVVSFLDLKAVPPPKNLTYAQWIDLCRETIDLFEEATQGGSHD